MRLLRRSNLLLVPGLLAVCVVVLSFVMLAKTETKVSAQPPLCRAAIAIDKSGSIDRDQLDAIRTNIRLLFEPGGLNSNDVHLAFWSFSNNAQQGANYNSPFNGFVSSAGVDSGFQENLARITTGGATNYEQGLGFDGYTMTNSPSSSRMNTRDGIDDIISEADVIIMMTDGEPNLPGAGGPNNGTAKNAGRAAAQAHLNAGRRLVGGYLQGVEPRSLRYVMNGSETRNTNAQNEQNIFEITNNFGDLTRQLRTWIQQECVHVIGEPEDDEPYSLIPTATSGNGFITGDQSATFQYAVQNTGEAETTSDRTTWEIRRILVEPDQSVDRLMFGTPGACGYNASNPANSTPYCDDMMSGCANLRPLINNRGLCNDTPVASGELVFEGGRSTPIDAFDAMSVPLDEGWQPGMNICHVLSIAQPTDRSTPRQRYSRAACLIVGKRPFVQIHGGDLRVGRYFQCDDNCPVADPDNPVDPARVVTSTTPKTDGRTYGSWAEYGVFSPGLVDGFASQAGLQGGYPLISPTAQELWSDLTFANTGETPNEYGKFTEDNAGQGTIPNYSRSVLSGRDIRRDFLDSENATDFNDASLPSGVYRKQEGNLTINQSTLAKGQTIIVSVPNGTVTIAGNLEYVDSATDRYESLEEIPQLIILARKIIINHNVNVVNAWLIADNEEDGSIITCEQGVVWDPAIGASRTVAYEESRNLTITTCNQPLRINGPVIARNLELRRTAGAGGGGDSGAPAEIINLPVNAYLWSQTAGRGDSRAQTTFVTELPPYF